MKELSDRQIEFRLARYYKRFQGRFPDMSNDDIRRCLKRDMDRLKRLRYEGIDTGTLIENIEPVKKIVSYQNKMYFLTEKLYPIWDYIKT